MMPMKLMLMTATAILLPAAVAAGPGGHGGGMQRGATMSATGPRTTTDRGPATMSGTRIAPTTTTHGSMGATNGAGWDHLNSPAHDTGQAFFECEDIRPGHSSTAPGSAFNEEGKAGTRYAGEQPQNSRNTSSVSQYDTACMHQPQH